MGKLVYITIQDHINKYPYKLHDVPSTYGPINTYFLDKGTVGSIFQSYPGERTSGRYSIATIIDMYFNNINFTFDSVEDMLEVEKYLGTYIAVLEQDTKHANREQLEYLNRAKHLFKFMKERNDAIGKRKSKKNKEYNIFSEIAINYKPN